MLIWMCALHCEAKPVIDFYRLKKTTDKTQFDLYQNENMMCVVSGMGADNMSRAVDWAYSLCNHQQQLCWINLGIAGHKHLPLGTIVLADRVTQHNTEKSFKLTHTISHPFEVETVTSLRRESTDYDESSLFDMESFAFMQSTRQLKAAELCQVIKVISDNQQTPPDRNKARISQLIADNMKPISAFAQHFLAK